MAAATHPLTHNPRTLLLLIIHDSSPTLQFDLAALEQDGAQHLLARCTRDLAPGSKILASRRLPEPK